MSKKKIDEIIEFFKSEEGYDKEEIITEAIENIKELKGNAADEISLNWDDEDLMTLDEFADQFYNKIINGVCNVLESFKNE